MKTAICDGDVSLCFHSLQAFPLFKASHVLGPPFPFFRHVFLSSFSLVLLFKLIILFKFIIPEVLQCTLVRNDWKTLPRKNNHSATRWRSPPNIWDILTSCGSVFSGRLDQDHPGRAFFFFKYYLKYRQ